MINNSDIMELVLLCAVIFFPLGYRARHWLPPLLQRLHLILRRPRYLKSAGVLRRNAAVRADKK